MTLALVILGHPVAGLLTVLNSTLDRATKRVLRKHINIIGDNSLTGDGLCLQNFRHRGQAELVRRHVLIHGPGDNGAHLLDGVRLLFDKQIGALVDFFQPCALCHRGR